MFITAAGLETAELHACVGGLLQDCKSPEAASVDFKMFAIGNLSGLESGKNVFYVKKKAVDAENPDDPRCTFGLKGGSIPEWLQDKWTAEVEFGTITLGGFTSFRTILWESCDPDSKTAGHTFGRASRLVKLLSEAAVPDRLHIRMTITPSTRSAVNGPQTLIDELADLRQSVNRLHPILRMLDQPSVDITRLIFPSKDGTVQYLYALSHLLCRYGYFQACHSSGFAETEQQVEGSSDVKDACTDDDREGCDPDSDAEWELQETKDVEHGDHVKFKATVHITDTSRRTFKGFIEWALCGALHFAPLRSAYREYLNGHKSEDDPVRWAKWANIHRTTIGDFGGFKTLTSPKSLYKLADKLIIPSLKALCCQQIIKCIRVENVIEEMNSLLFQQHPDLLQAAHNFIVENWDRVVQEDQFNTVIQNLSPSAAKTFHQNVLLQVTHVTTNERKKRKTQ